MKVILAVAVGSALFLSACAGAQPRLKVGRTPEGEVVEAEGRCPIVDDVDSARKCSLAEAQKAAVERVVGVFISARTRVEKAVAIEQNILAKTEGYVRKYDIVAEGRTKDNFYKTTVRALIPPQEIEQDLERLIKSSAVGNPRVAVMLDELVDGDVTDRLRATQALTETLLNTGFKVVDREALAQANAMAQIKAIESGDVAKINSLAKTLQAELLLVGSAQSLFNTDKGLGGLASYRATVSLQAVKAGTGEIVKAVSKTASGVEVNREMASDKARENAANLVAEILAEDLPKALSKKSGVSLEVRGISSLSDLAEIRKALQAVPGVQNIYTRSYEAGTAVMDIDTTSADAEDLAGALEKVRAVPLRVTEASKDHLRAQVAAR